MRRRHHHHKRTQRVVVEVDLLPGRYTEAVAEKLFRSLIEELLNIDAEVTAVRLEINGPMAPW